MSVVKIKEHIRRIEEGDDFVLSEWPTLKNEALYGAVGSFVKDATEHTEADKSAVLMTLMTRLGAYFGRNACLWNGGMSFPPKLYACVVGRSAKGRKGTSVYPVVDVAEKIDALLINEGLTPVRAIDGTASSGEGLVYMLRDPSDKKDADGKPDDEGVEDKRIFILEEELGGLLKVSKREGNTVTAALRKFWDPAGNFAPITKSQPIKATGTHICMVAHVTFGELLTHLNSVESSNGFANRFLWVCARRSKIEPAPKAIPARRLDVYAGEFAAAVKFAGGLSGGVKLSDDAVQRWHEIYVALSAERGGLVGNLCDRAEPQVLRVATIFALIDKSYEVTPAHLNAALAVWQYCEDSIKYIFGADIDPDEQRIMRYLTDQGGSEVAQSVISRRLFNGKPGLLANKLLRLEEQGRIVRRWERGNGRTSTFWKIAKTQKGENNS